MLIPSAWNYFEKLFHVPYLWSLFAGGPYNWTDVFMWHWPFGAFSTTWLLDSMLLFQIITQMNFLAYNFLFVRNSDDKKRTTENKDWSVSESGKKVTEIYTVYCQLLNRGSLVKYTLLFGLTTSSWSQQLTFWRRNYFFNFSTSCI